MCTDFQLDQYSKQQKMILYNFKIVVLNMDFMKVSHRCVWN